MLSPLQRLLFAASLLGIVAGVTLGIHYASESVVRRPSSVVSSNEAALLRTTDDGLRTSPDPPEFFPGQPPPELVLMLTGQTYGYLQPCGCSRPQLGGLERQYELLRQLRARGWVVSAADLGDIAPKQTDEQGRLKYETAMQTLHEMGYAAAGLGLTEMAMPLEEAFGLAQNFQPPVILAANLKDKDTRFPGMVRGWTIHEPQAERGRSQESRVGYIGLVAESMASEAKKRDPSLAFEPIDEALPSVLRQIQESQPDVLVLLLQGTRAEAREIAKEYRHPRFDVILVRDENEEPAWEAERVDGTLLVSLGQKGRHVGLIAVYPSSRDGLLAGARFQLQYQLVALTGHFELAEDKTNVARERLRDYVLRIHQELSPGVTFLTKYPRHSHPLQLDQPDARFAGSAACKECHPKAYDVWSRSRHSHAYETLVEHGRPIVRRELSGATVQVIGRQSDPECVKCHTTGFEYRGGYVDERATPHLFGNGCENCHGPASLHVARPREPQFSAPLRLTVATVEATCRRCHDRDNDPHFELQSYWEKIKHGRE